MLKKLLVGVIALALVMGVFLGLALTGVLGGKVVKTQVSTTTPTTYAPPTITAPTTVPPVAPTTTNDLSGFMPHEIVAGTTERLPAGICIEGDVKVNGVAYYDDVAQTGLVTCLRQPAKVTAPWGAYASDADANAQEADLLDSGCGLKGGCTKVILKFWPSS